jgi:MFS family permease
MYMPPRSIDFLLHRTNRIATSLPMTTQVQAKPMPWWKEPTRGQWASFTAAWVGWVLDAFDFTIYILVMSHIAKEFGVGIAAVAGSLTLTLLVRLAGGAVAGWMADRWGRKLPLMLSLLWFATFDAAIYFAPSFTWVLIFRTLFGFGMGAEWAAGTAMAMEAFPPRSRKIASGLLQAGWPIGFLLAAATAYLVVPAWGWRAMFLIAMAPALLVHPDPVDGARRAQPRRGPGGLDRRDPRPPGAGGPEPDHPRLAGDGARLSSCTTASPPATRSSSSPSSACPIRRPSSTSSGSRSACWSGSWSPASSPIATASSPRWSRRPCSCCRRCRCSSARCLGWSAWARSWAAPWAPATPA